MASASRRQSAAGRSRARMNILREFAPVYPTPRPREVFPLGGRAHVADNRRTFTHRGRTVADAPDTRIIAQKAVDLIEPNMVVGLGTGAAATQFIHALGERVKTGLHIRGIPTSDVSGGLAKQLGIPLVTFDDVEAIDVCVDGADEVDPACDLIKGYGGALLREKVVAGFSRMFVVLVGPAKDPTQRKIVPALGTNKKLPVEVVQFALTPARRQIAKLGFDPVLRMTG